MDSFDFGAIYIPPWLIILLIVCAIALTVLIINRGILVHRTQATTGREELAGKTAVVVVALEPDGMILFRGERWTAVSESGRIEPGEEVTINRVDNLRLYVTKKQ